MKTYKKRLAIVALDVGGTSISGAVVSENGTVLTSVQEIDSPQHEPAETIIRSLTTFVGDLRKLAEQKKRTVRCVGVGMPGPFDYDRGISWMQHKFQALYGHNLKGAFEHEVGLPVLFVNDAVAFAIGVWWTEYPLESRLIALTLGTGLGSGFLVDGRVATEADGAPLGGELWNFLYRDGILEDFVSRRAIERVYQQRGGGAQTDVRAIAERAREGDQAAQWAFSEMADALGEGVALAVNSFRPTRIVVGGQISKAHDLFLYRTEKRFADQGGLRVPFSETHKENAALIGAAHHALTKLQL